MARKYDIINRLRSKNEKPFVCIDEEHSYNIDTSMPNVMAIMAMESEYEKKEDADSVEMVSKIIKMALGESALEYIMNQGMTYVAISEIISTIVAAVSNKDLDDFTEDSDGETEKK